MILVLLVAFAGFWFGKAPVKKQKTLVEVHPEKQFPLSEHKSFVVVMYAYNQVSWCERALRSVFEQDYDHYRVIVIDDGSVDGTAEKASQFIVDNHQEDKVIFIRNETRRGEAACLYRAIDECLDREIVIPLAAKDWLSSPSSFNQLNRAYQNPDVWLSFGKAIEYPSYEINQATQLSFYAALFKQIRMGDLFENGHFVGPEAYLGPLIDMAGGRIRNIEDPVAFLNTTSSVLRDEPPLEIAEYEPLNSFPSARAETTADILIFSFDRPLQLYACLESVQRYMTGFETLMVLYRASSDEFARGYDRVKDAFPTVNFVAQSMEDPKCDFKPNVQKFVFDSPSEYILFGVDDLIVKDFVDLKLCMERMEKTGAYGFYLRLGRHINQSYQAGRSQTVPLSLPLGNGIYAWDLETGEADWKFANSLDMTLFKKEEIEKALVELKYQTPNSLELAWAEKDPSKKAIGLYFERSKLVNIPMNVVGDSGNPSMNYLNSDELLARFNQGFKIDIDPLYKVENASPHLDYIPEFVLR